MDEESRYEEPKTKLGIFIIFGLIVIFVITFFVGDIKFGSTGINDWGFRFLLLSFIYILALAIPQIYNYILRSRFLNLKNVSITQWDKNVISPAKIIEIDVTAIFGILILVTILSLDSTSQFDKSACVANQQNPDSQYADTLPPLGRGFVLMTCVNPSVLMANVSGTVVMIFSLSAIAVAISKFIEVGIRIMVGGFVYLFLAMLILAYI